MKEEIKNEIIRLYTEEKLSVFSLSNKYKETKENICILLSNKNIHIRNDKEQKNERQNYLYHNGKTKIKDIKNINELEILKLYNLLIFRQPRNLRKLKRLKFFLYFLKP